jgi:hypothetical protein
MPWRSSRSQPQRGGQPTAWGNPSRCLAAAPGGRRDRAGERTRKTKAKVRRDQLTPSPSLSRRERDRRTPFPSFQTSKHQSQALPEKRRAARLCRAFGVVLARRACKPASEAEPGNLSAGALVTLMAPRLRDYPQVRLFRRSSASCSTPTARHMTSATCGIEAVGRNPFRVEELFQRAPQGSRQRTRQPWAMLRNAFGVERVAGVRRLPAAIKIHDKIHDARYKQ